MTYQYHQIESALISTFCISDDELGAFRAKIRRLRELGIPSAPKTGSGSKIEYEPEHVNELAIALAFNSLGVAPRLLPKLVRVVLNQYNSSIFNKVYSFITKEGSEISFWSSMRDLNSVISKTKPIAFSVVNVSELLDQVHKACI